VPIRVKVDQRHRPLAVVVQGKYLKITGIQEVWEVDLEWWRPRRIFRRYYRVSIQDRREMTIFQDLAEGGWYGQRA
jgi:hypothetical protein